MNMMMSKEWCQLAWQTISKLPGQAPEMLRVQWDAHAVRQEVVVTLFGPYDSGKSSLLKRLLVDEGSAVPDWLTISAQPETFEVNEVEVAGVAVYDTPGIVGGNERHALAAIDALTVADVIVLVLPPQIVTSGKHAFMSVLSGDHFCCKPDVAYAERGMAVMLSRMDEAGVLPDDDPEGYAALKSHKAKEFDALLRKTGGMGDVVALFMTVSDPYGLVANNRSVDRSAYDIGRSWDGIESFAGFLHGLAGRKHELRQHAEMRFLGAAVKNAAETLLALRRERNAALEAADGESRMHALSVRRLTALLDSAKVDLDRCISEEVAAASRRGGADSNELRQIIGDRLDAALDRWAARHDAAVDTWLQDVDGDLKDRQKRASSKPLWVSLDDDEAPVESRGARKAEATTLGKMKKLAATLHKGFRELHVARFGMTVQKSGDELQRLSKASSFAEYVKETGKKAVRFQDAKQADSAKWSMRGDIGLATAVPAILELGSLIIDARSEQQRAEKLAERRTKAAHAIEVFTKRVAADAWKWWCDDGLPAAAIESLRVAQQAAEEMKAALAVEVESVEVVLKSVDDCLGHLREMSESHDCPDRDGVAS